MQENRKKWNTEKISVFWRFFAMMCGFLVLIVAVMLASREQLTDVLVEKNLNEVQLSLNSSCQQLSDSLYAISEIPNIVEHSVPYSRIVAEKSEALPYKYYPAAMEIRSLLISQATYLGNCTEIMIYIPDVDTVCSKQLKVKSCTDYFSGGVSFAKTDEAAVVENIHQKSALTLYPVDEVEINSIAGADRYFIVTAHPAGCSTGVMTIFPESMLLNVLNYDRLPEGSYLKITTKDGGIFEQYPADFPMDDAEYYWLTSNVSKLNLSVTVWLPMSYFQSLMKPFYRNMVINSGLFLLLAFAMCIVFSKASAKPLQELVERMQSEEELPQNELKALDRFITKSGLELASLKDRLVQSQLIRLFFGNALTVEEEKHLKKDLNGLDSLRIALIETERNADQLKLAADVEQQMEKKCRSVIISRTEMGFLFSGDDESLNAMVLKINEINSAAPGSDRKLKCGISDVFSDLDDFNVALRQARAAIPQKFEARVFAPDSRIAQNIVISWTPHEKLYRSILSKNEAEALTVIRKAAMATDTEHAEIFYDNLAFVILCSANEVGIDTRELKIWHYDERLSAADNFCRLEYPLKRLLTLVNMLENNQEDNKKQQVMRYIRENFCDSSLCIAQIAEELKIRESDVSETVRQYTSQSFVDYIADLRMKKVVDLMADFDRSLSDIAEACGYPAESTFYRVFKSHYNKTPATYRKNLMRELNNAK